MTRIRSYRLLLDRSVELGADPPSVIRGSADAALLATALTEDEPVEVFLVALLDTQHRVLPQGIVTITRGTMSSSLIHAREVFLPAIHFRAHALLCMHNHPSGVVDPSPDDRAITTQLVEAGKLLEIPVIDHIIVAPTGEYFSFVEAALL